MSDQKQTITITIQVNPNADTIYLGVIPPDALPMSEVRTIIRAVHQRLLEQESIPQEKPNDQSV